MPGTTSRLRVGLGDEVLASSAPFASATSQPDDVAAEDVEDHVQVEVRPLGRPLSLVMSHDQTWLGAVASSSGLVVRVAQIVAPLAHLPLSASMRYMVRIEQR